MALPAEWAPAPVIYEIDTWPWLTDLSRRHGRTVTLGDVPADDWDAVVPPGTDAVWLMGVWERSPAGLEVALADAGLQEGFRGALPDLTDGDVVGSPYCVRRYTVDVSLGGPEALAVARDELARRGARLVLDYVPNHLAPDHPWVRDHPERFVQGNLEDLTADPEAWWELGGRVLAHGRDPYFPAWPDVVQLNAFSGDTRAAMAEELIGIGAQCDGVRCDMAMLALNDVFSRTWGRWTGPAPDDELWPGVIATVRGQHPDMLFVAEAYWDLEWRLIELGFDFCYDKRLYDRLLHEDAASVRGHLTAGLDYQGRLVRFLENHDEPRAAAALAPDRARAAAVVVATVPGATLWHDGQLDGRRVHLPVFLGRRPAEPVDADLQRFYRRLLAVVAESDVRSGEWSLLDCTGWPDNDSARNLVAWAWTTPQLAHVVVVNLSAGPAQGRVRLPWPSLGGAVHPLEELMSGTVLKRDGDELVGEGLYVDLPAWGSHLLAAPF